MPSSCAPASPGSASSRRSTAPASPALIASNRSTAGTLALDAADPLGDVLGEGSQPLEGRRQLSRAVREGDRAPLHAHAVAEHRARARGKVDAELGLRLEAPLQLAG